MYNTRIVYPQIRPFACPGALEKMNNLLLTWTSASYLR
jgi:hypothetical protein